MLFKWFFGEEWEVSGVYSQTLIFSYAFSFIISPLGNVLIALNRLKLATLFPVLYFLLILLLYLLKPTNINQFIFDLTCVDITAYGIYGLVIYIAVLEYEKSLKEKL